jgi:hypothetical protein
MMKNPPFLLTVLLTVSIVVLMGGKSLAQDVYVAPLGPGSLSGNNVWVSGLILQEQLFDRQPQDEPMRRPPPQTRGQTPQTQAFPGQSVLSFSTSSQRRLANYRTIVQNWRANRNSPASDAETLLLGGDILAALAPSFNTTLGLQTNNLADAYGYWLGVSWLAANRSDQPLTRAQFEGLRQQIGAELSGNVMMSLANDEAKQTLSETALINGLFTARAASRSASDPAQRQALAQQTTAAVKKAMKVDLATVQLTDKGFEPR